MKRHTLINQFLAFFQATQLHNNRSLHNGQKQVNSSIGKAGGATEAEQASTTSKNIVLPRRANIELVRNILLI